jgi:tetratricopeptide (TPR) repeat protein
MQVSALNKQASVMALYLGQFQESEHLLERAEQLALQHNEKSGIPEMHLLRCLMCTAQADFENVVYYMDQVVQVGEEQNNPHFVAMGMVHVATSLIYLTRFEQAEEHALKALQVTRQIGDRMHETHLLSEALPLIAFHHGDFEQAETYLQQGLQIANRINYLESQSLSAYFLAELARWRGDYENALSYASAALKTALPLEEYTPFVLPPILGSLGMIYLEISPQFHDKTLELHQHALRVLETPMGMLMGGLPWADLGLCAVMTGDLPLAETVIATGLNTPNTFALIERPRQVAAAAQLAGLKSDWAEAIRLADEARADAEGHALRQHFPLTALVQGEMRLGAAQYTEALAALETAQQEAGAFGMRPITWQAHAAAAQAHEALGRIREAEQARAAADRVIAEIAGQFEDQELRQIFLAAHKPLTR